MPEPLAKCREGWRCNSVGNGLMAGKVAEIGERRMGAVKAAKLHQLMWLDVGNHLCAICAHDESGVNEQSMGAEAGSEQPGSRRKAPMGK